MNYVVRVAKGYSLRAR